VFFGALKMAFTSIAAHKARAFLTTLGVIIGVSSVITLLAIGEGLKNDVKQTVGNFGSQVFFVIPGDLGAFTSGGRTTTANPANFISGDILTTKDVAAIRRLRGVEKAFPVTIIPETVRKDGQPSSAMLAATEPGALGIFPAVTLSDGRDITSLDSNDNVVVLGDRPAEQLFEDDNPVGDTVTIGQETFTVVGKLTAPESIGALTGSDFENISFIPFDTGTRLIGNEQIHRIGVKAEDGFDSKNVAEAVREDLATRHEEGDVSVVTPDDMLDLLSSLLSTVASAVSAIAAISLLVGGIGIMNIMLVSVTERTREIGIRKAVGATKWAIMIQFLIEAIVVSAIGGGLGLGLAMIGVVIVDLKTALVPAITPFMITLAVGVSVGVGIIFGLAPAISAARKDPIEALRYE